MRSAAGLHANQLHLQVRGEGQQLPARTFLADHHPTCRIQSYRVKNRFAQIDAEHV
jgi:hypothetical protein